MDINLIPEDSQDRIYYCDYCGGIDLLQEAWVPLNGPKEFRLRDSILCESCGTENEITTTESVTRSALGAELVLAKQNAIKAVALMEAAKKAAVESDEAVEEAKEVAAVAAQVIAQLTTRVVTELD